MLRRRMKFDVAQVCGCNPKGNLKGLNRAIQILVIDSVLIMPNAGGGTRDLVADEHDAIVSRIRFDWVTVAPVQALIAGCIRTVEPTGVKVKFVVPLTLYRR